MAFNASNNPQQALTLLTGDHVDCRTVYTTGQDEPDGIRCKLADAICPSPVSIRKVQLLSQHVWRHQYDATITDMKALRVPR
ncbi:MAG: hypothetical protein WD772_08840, partial [Pseudohongiellaceae bacterium]